MATSLQSSIADSLQAKLSEIHHHEIEKFLNALNREQLFSLGAALGLCYPKLRRKEEHLLGDLISGWLNMEDNVKEVSGTPCWASLIKVLEDKGHRGIASKIKESKTTSECLSSPPSGNTAIPTGDVVGDKHIPFIVRKLSGQNARNWRKIGRALEFREQDLENITTSKSMSPYSFLQRLVEKWIKGKYPHIAPPTLANLVNALNIVGLESEAKQIRDSLHKHDPVVMECVFHSKEECSMTFDQINRIVKMEENTNATLTSQSISCGSSKYTVNGDIDHDGDKIMVKIHCQYTSHLLDTIPVTLRVSCHQLDQFKENLASIYLAKPEVPEDTWPPVSNKTYINLALIKQQQAINYGGEYARLTIRGDMDDILHHKEKIEYKNIFNGLRSGSLLLIEGRPGSGKTTFVHKITRDWAASEVRGPMRLVLLVSLRVLNSWEKPLTLEDIIKLLNLQVSPIVLQNRNGKGVCFIFDGLDEFSPLEKENSIVYKIINKEYLSKSIVIVASRPVALVKLRIQASKVVEVIGFPKDQIFQYVEIYPFTSSSKVEQLKSYLLSHPNVLHMCYLHIHAAMVAFLFEVMGTIPRTETEIYKHFTRFTLMRNLSKHKGQDELEDFDTNNLNGEERELFNTICEIALEKTELNKQVLDQDDLKMRLKSRESKDVSLGLVTVDRTAGLYGFKNVYTFLHLTYQEYLAAHHISKLSDEDQLKLIKQYRDTDHMQIVWKFYFGLVNFERHEYKIKALVHGKRSLGLHDIQCAYESQNKAVCVSLLEQLNSQITLQNKYLTITDFTALGFSLVNSPSPVELNILNCDGNSNELDAFLEEISHNPPSLQSLCFHSDTLKSVNLIDKCNIQTLETLSFKDSTNQLDSFAENLNLDPNRRSLVECLASNLLTCTSLKSLTISCWKLFDDGAEILAKGIKSCCSLEAIDISGNSIGNGGGLAIFESLSHTKVKILKYDSIMSGNNIEPEYFSQCLSKLLKPQNLKLEVEQNRLWTLVLKCRKTEKEIHVINFTNPPISTIIQCLPFYYFLETLELVKCALDSSSTSILARRLLICTMLREIDLSDNGIDMQQLDDLFIYMKHCRNLQKIILCGNPIGDGAVDILRTYVFYNWPSLQVLNLHNCGFSMEGRNLLTTNLQCSIELII